MHIYCLKLTHLKILLMKKNNSTLPDKLPSKSSTYPLPTANEIDFSCDEKIIQIDSKAFLSGSSGNGLSFIVAYGGEGGVVDTSIDRSMVTFQFDQNSSNGSFRFLIRSSSGGIDSSTCYLSYNNATK